MSRRRKAAVGAVLVAVIAAAAMLALRKKDEPTPAPAGTSTPEVAWGEAVKGLRAGLSAAKRTYTPDEPLSFVLHLRNEGKERLKVPGYMSFWWHGWGLVFTPAGGASLRAQPREGLPIIDAPSYIILAPGEEKAVPLASCRLADLRFAPPGDATGDVPLPPGRCTVRASYVLVGGVGGFPISTASVEIEIVKKGATPGKIAWGEAFKGLAVGVSAEKTTFVREEPIALKIHLRNVTRKTLDLGSPTFKPWWYVEFAPQGSGVPRLADPSDRGVTLEAVVRSLAPGEEIAFDYAIGGTFQFIDARKKKTGLAAPLKILPKGRYLVTARCESGAIGLKPNTPIRSGKLEIEVATTKIAWGKAIKGLQLGLAFDPSAPGKRPVFVLRNVGKWPIRFRLDDRTWPRQRNLVLATDGPDGRTEMGWTDPLSIAIPAEVDDYAPLSPGESRRLFWAGGEAGYRPGKYRFRASYTITASAAEEARKLGANNLWTGKVTTAPVEIEIAAARAAVSATPSGSPAEEEWTLERARRTKEGERRNGQPYEGLFLYDGWTMDTKTLVVYREGKLHGPTLSWYENGRERYKGQFRDGVRVGIWRRWNNDGTLYAKGEYRNGKPWNGTFIDSTYAPFPTEYRNGVRQPSAP